MAWLVMLVVGAWSGQVVQKVECQFAVMFRVLYWLVYYNRYFMFDRFLCHFAVFLLIPQIERLFSIQDFVDTSIRKAGEDSVFKRVLYISCSTQLLPYPRILHVFLILLDNSLVLVLVLWQSKLIINGLSSLDTRLNGSMWTFNLQNIHEAGTASCKDSSRESKLWNTKISAWIQGSSTIWNALPPFEKLSYFWMHFKSLKLLIRVYVWVFVVQTNDKSDVDVVRCHMIQERPCIRFWIKRPAYCVLNVSWFKVRVGWVDLPNLFQTNSI